MLNIKRALKMDQEKYTITAGMRRKFANLESGADFVKATQRYATVYWRPGQVGQGKLADRNPFK